VSISRAPRRALRRVLRQAGVAAFVAGMVVVPPAVHAQGSRRVDPSATELAISVGRLDLAEAVLFEEARRAPREPTVRGALGIFLAGRGKFLVGATLLEEALQFGGDTASIQERLLEVYRWAAQYDRTAALPEARMIPEEREAMRRAAGTAVGGAAAAIVPLQPNEAFGLGRFTLLVGSEPVDADIQPLTTGVQLPASPALFGAVEPVSARGDTTWAVARTLSIGRVTIGPVPVQLVPGLRTARIGLDVLGQLSPTFDGAARTLTVRSSDAAPTGDARPFLLTFPGLTFVAREGQPPVPLNGNAGRSALRGRRWTLDLASGAIVIEP
jgi:hypothetical protein